MPITVNDVNELKAYIDGVMQRADHHARNVQGVALALAGAIVWKKDEATDIQVRRGTSGATANVLWVTMNGQRYAFSYNHHSGEIEMRRDSLQGPVVATFTDNMPLAQIEQTFRPL